MLTDIMVIKSRLYITPSFLFFFCMSAIDFPNKKQNKTYVYYHRNLQCQALFKTKTLNIIENLSMFLVLFFLSTFLCLPWIHQTYAHTYKTYAWLSHILFFIYLFSTQTSFRFLCQHAYSCCLFISNSLFLDECLILFFSSSVCVPFKENQFKWDQKKCFYSCFYRCDTV